MAEEVGAGYVSLIPSLKGFSRSVKRMLAKELRGADATIPVQIEPKIDRKAFAASILGRQRALKVPVDLVQRGGVGKLGALRQKVDLDVDKGSLLGRLFGGRASLTEKVKVDVDVDKDRLRSTAGKAATEAGSKAGGMFAGGFSSALLNPIIGIPAATAAVLLAIPLGAAVAAATVAGAGLGAVFFGAFLLKDDPQIKAAVTGLFGEVKATMLDAVKPLKGPFLDAIRLVGEGFRDIAPDIKDFFSTIGKSGGIQELGRGIKGFLKSFAETGALKKLGETIGPVLSQLGMALPDIGNALSQFLIEISKPETIDAVGKMFRLLADGIRLAGDVIGWLTGKFDMFMSLVKWTGERIDDTVTGLNALRKAFMGDTEALGQLGQVAWNIIKWIGDTIIGLARKIAKGLGFEDAVTKVKAIPSKILAALGNTGTLLLNAGKNVVQGLIDGIKSKFGGLGDIASTMAGILRDHLPFSPAKTGPLSGSGNPFHSGQVIAGDVAKGVQSQLPAVATAAGQLAGQFSPGGRGGAASAAPAVFEIRGDGSQFATAMIAILKESIRQLNGGNVNLALGS